MSYWLHPEAETELGDAAAYYVEHASLAVGEAFLAEFERVLDLLIENPHRGPKGEYGLRLYHLDRFPYTLVYAPHDQLGPQIFAIAHQHREPGYWSPRVDV